VCNLDGTLCACAVNNAEGEFYTRCLIPDAFVRTEIPVHQQNQVEPLVTVKSSRYDKSRPGFNVPGQNRMCVGIYRCSTPIHYYGYR